MIATAVGTLSRVIDSLMTNRLNFWRFFGCLLFPRHRFHRANNR